MNIRPVYLDNAASTRPSTEVVHKLMEVLSSYGNPSSIHEEGVKAKKIVSEATNIIARKINCKPSEIHYTTGATMSNSLAIQGFSLACAEPFGYKSVIVASEIEHNDIMLMLKKSKIIEKYSRVYYVGVDNRGFVSLDSIAQVIDTARFVDSPILFTIQYANGEVGTIQNIREISSIIHSHPGCYIHVDATQMIGHKSIDVVADNIDMLSMSGQKINGIKGTGILYIKEGTPISSIIFGEQDLVGGTENVSGIACLGEAFSHLYEKSEHSLQEKCAYFTRRMIEIGNVHTVGADIGNDRVPGNMSFIIDGVHAEAFVLLLSEQGIYVSSGSACSSIGGEPSHVLLAMGYSKEEAMSYIRITINDDITYDEIDYCIDVIKHSINFMRGVR